MLFAYPRLVVLIKGRKDGKVAVKKTVTRKGVTFQQTFWVSPAEAAAWKKQQAASKKAATKKKVAAKTTPEKATPKKAAAKTTPEKATPKKAAAKTTAKKAAPKKASASKKEAYDPWPVAHIPKRKPKLAWGTKKYFETATQGDVMGALVRGVDLNARKEDGSTILHTALSVSRVSPSVIRYLYKEKGIPRGARDNKGQTPLHIAARHANAYVLFSLPEWGEDLNAMDDQGYTPLHRAIADNEDPLVAKMFIDAGADVNMQSRGGYTPLLEAARQRHPNPKVIMALLDAGADPKVTGYYGKTAWDYIKNNTTLKGTAAYKRLERMSE